MPMANLSTEGRTTTQSALSITLCGMSSGISMISFMTRPALATRSDSFFCANAGELMAMSRTAANKTLFIVLTSIKFSERYRAAIPTRFRCCAGIRNSSAGSLKCRGYAGASERDPFQLSGAGENTTVAVKRHMTKTLQSGLGRGVPACQHFLDLAELLLDARFRFRVGFCHENQLHGDEKYAGFQKHIVGESVDEQCHHKQAEGQRDDQN